MIKQARGPARRVMTPRAIGGLTAPLELSGMDVFVTSHAAIGRRLERNLPYAGVLGLAVMTVDTGQHAMSSRQLVPGAGMVERLELLPGIQAVATFAETPPFLDARAQSRRELTLVRVLVAPFAGTIGEVIGPACSVRSGSFSMAVFAGGGGVRTFQGKRGRLVARQAECRGLETIYGVTILAPAGVRGPCELPPMWVAMTVSARFEGGMIVGVEAGGRVALCARHSSVFGGERKCRGRMPRFRERGGPEAIRGVAGAALAVIGAALKLTPVLILVAIHALRMRDRSLEVRVLMALLAGQGGVLALQRELRLTVVERVGQANLAPAAGIVAAFAARRERSLVRVPMTPAALREFEPRVLSDLGIRRERRMAPGARNLLVAAGQGKAGAGVVERNRRLPVGWVVAALAICSQLSGVAVFVAGQALRG